jgi:hypothetical protein
MKQLFLFDKKELECCERVSFVLANKKYFAKDKSDIIFASRIKRIKKLMVEEDYESVHDMLRTMNALR